MPRLPQASDLRQATTPSNTPDVKVPGIDYGPMASGGRAIAEGIQSIGRAGGAFAASLQANQVEVDDYETKKRLLDFTDRAEQELETYKRQMPAGGEGYAAGWQQRYKEMAGEFVGPNDANVPAAQRAKIGLQLKQYERQLHERAWRDENAERDRTELAGLEETVTRQASKVAIDPTRHDDVQREVESLIELNQKLPQTIKDAYRKKARERLSEEAAQAYAARATTKEGLDEARRVLAPNMPDKPESTRLAARYAGGSPMEVAKQFLGSTESRDTQVLSEFFAKAGGQKLSPRDTAWCAAFVNAALGASGQQGSGTLLARDFLKVGTATKEPAEGDIVVLSRGDPRSWQGHVGFYAGKDENGNIRVLGGNQGDAVSVRSFPASQVLGFRKPPAAGTKVEGVVPAEDAGGYMNADVETYAGSIGLPLAKRRAAVARAEQTYRTAVGDVQGSIREQMKASEKGVLPPEDWLKVVEPRVKALGDPETNALYATMIGKANVTAQFRTLPPGLQQIAAQRARASIGDGATAEEVAYVEHQEKLAAEAKTQASKNLIGWANRNRPVVALTDDAPPEGRQLIMQGRGDEAIARFPGHFAKAEFPPLDFSALRTTNAAPSSFRAGQEEDGRSLAAQLDRRLDLAKRAATYANEPIQMFAENERKVLQDFLKTDFRPKNGERDPMLAIFGEVAAATARANVDATVVLQEIAPKESPEIAMIGHLVGVRADEGTLRNAAAALRWKVGLGENFVPTINKATAQPSLGEYEKVFQSSPTARDSLRSLASMVYEYEARQKGETTFNPDTYKSVVHRLMGETTDQAGNTYGGVGWQGGAFFNWSNWTDGRSASQVLVPSDVKQDSFDKLLGSIRADDLVKLNAYPYSQPDNGKPGTPYSMSEIRNMTWVSVGPPGAPPIAGLYTLVTSNGPARRQDGEKFVVDLRPLLPDLRKRKPSIFAGYQAGMEHDQYGDQLYPTGVEGLKPYDPLVGDGATRSGASRRSTLPAGVAQ